MPGEIISDDMPGARLCHDCWRVTTEFSQRLYREQKNPAQPGPVTCDVCRLVRDSIIAFRDLGDKPELRGSDFATPWVHSDRYPVRGADVTFTRPLQSPGAKRTHHDLNESADFKVIKKAKLDITTLPGQKLPWGGFSNATDIASYSGNEKCFAKIDQWLEECFTEHNACRKSSIGNTEKEGPTRLIDTGPLDGDIALKLVDYPHDDGDEVKYCALSYCWGKEGENYTTTRETYESRCEGMKLEELPWMFRDAVVISRRVGCRYLWIDAICIIQKDRLDWEFEAHRMYSIYGNAFLVIAASHPSSPTASIFTTRQLTAQFDFDCAGQTYRISVKERVNHSIWQSRFNYDFRTVPLHSRAWALQERLLARRVIHYGPSELFWECRTHARCECSGIQRPDLARDYTPGKSFKSEVVEALAVGEAAEHAGRAWRSVVSQYSARQLTFKTDRLPALSGLAEQFAYPQMGKYLAGIWYSQLPDALDWHITNPRKTDEYLAPSWCWASLDGAHITQGGAREVELIDADCTPAGDDPYGAVSDGYIVVRGEFGPIPKPWRDAKEYDVSVGDDEDVWALKMRFADWDLWHALLLRKSKCVDGSWERIGNGVVSDVCFDGRERTIIRIV